MPGYKANLAENRAINASEERGVNVPLAGTMRALRPAGLSAPHVGSVKPPRVPKIPGMGKRKYYGEM